MASLQGKTALVTARRGELVVPQHPHSRRLGRMSWFTTAVLHRMWNR
jgi:hypothetical protein